MSKRKNTIIIICFVLVILLGAGAAAYPLIASINNEHAQSLVQVEYEEKLEQLDTSEIDAALAAAREYNKTISTVQIEDVDKIKESLPPYEDLLNLANNGIMGYIEIPAINIDLPIYHGTTGAAMEKGAGHMEGTSLPVGGVGTHAVISAHSGMASAKLFTDIDQLEVGDKFYIHVLDEVLAYKVDQILPMVDKDDHETLEKALQIEEGKDQVTLFTCTPYGVNSHRLLVRGTRVPYNGEEDATESVTDSMVKAIQNYYMLYLILGLSITILVIILLRFLSKRKAHKE